MPTSRCIRSTSPSSVSGRRGAQSTRAAPESVPTGRSEGFVVGQPDLDETIRRLQAYADAGADCLYAPRIETTEQVSAVVAALAPKPINLLANAPFITVAEAASLGVRRISVGGTLARTAWAGFLAAAEEIATEGTFTRFAGLPNVDAVSRTLTARTAVLCTESLRTARVGSTPEGGTRIEKRGCVTVASTSSLTWPGGDLTCGNRRTWVSAPWLILAERASYA